MMETRRKYLKTVQNQILIDILNKHQKGKLLEGVQ